MSLSNIDTSQKFSLFFQVDKEKVASIIAQALKKQEDDPDSATDGHSNGGGGGMHHSYHSPPASSASSRAFGPVCFAARPPRRER